MGADRADPQGAGVPVKKSDLGVRSASAVVMVALTGAALWLGGYVWALCVAMVAAGVLWEWARLLPGVAGSALARGIWLVAGAIYIGVAALTLGILGFSRTPALALLLAAVLGVIATDVGAYFAGRTFGGPKIAPAISPSKTWSGMIGGMIAAGVTLNILVWNFYPHALSMGWPRFAAVGAGLAIVAQTGDFFESWMKRRAGVKDSGHLIPGHGGLFDRLDGLLAVLFVVGIIAGIGRLF